jgi:hypothetical protein
MADNTREDDRHRGLADTAVALVAREASRVPLFALTAGLQVWERTRGLRQQAMRHGAVALQLAAHTPLGRFLPQPDLDDGAQDEAARILQHAREARNTLTDTRSATSAAEKPSSATAKPSGPKRATTTAEKTPAKTTTKAATKAASKADPPPAAVEVGAPGAVSEKVEEVADKLAVAEPESRDDLPIPDFDNISIGSLRARLRSLSAEQLVTLREWEQAHAHRLPVITLLDNRIAKVAADAGTTATASAAESSSSNRTDDTASANPAAAAEAPYPAEAPATGQEAADRAEAAAEGEGGTLRI